MQVEVSVLWGAYTHGWRFVWGHVSLRALVSLRVCRASENVTVSLNVGLWVYFYDGVCACVSVGVSVGIPLWICQGTYVSKDTWVFVFVYKCVCGCVECVCKCVQYLGVYPLVCVSTSECESAFLEGVCLKAFVFL